MLLELGWFLAGILTGSITGLIPGIHPNTITVLLLPLYPIFPSSHFLAFIVSLAVTNTVFDLLPAIFIGVPEEDTVMALMPTHQLVQEGLGYYALKLTIYGALVGSGLAVLLTLLALPHISPIYAFLTDYMAYAIILFLAIMILTEPKPLASVLILLLAGGLGILVLNATPANTQFILFPLLTGLFATAPLFYSSMQTNTTAFVHSQQPVHIGTAMKGGIIGTAASFLVGFIPGIGDAQSALFFNKLTHMRRDDFVVALGGINTAGIILSFISLYAIGRTRSGAAVAISQSLDTITFSTVLSIIALSIIAVGISVIFCLLVGKKGAHTLAGLNMATVNRTVLVMLLILIIILTGIYGLIVFLTASAIGIFTVSIGVKRSFCMGVLLLPTLLFYLGVGPLLI